MSTTETAPTQHQKKSVSAKTAALIVLAILLTLFAVMNYAKQAEVWPLQGQHPVIVVIVISFILGGLIGWLGRSITARTGFLNQ